ncbi:MAG: SGNH/GDSL hydrolase family protein [Pyrinomonadaceae bacterium]
MMSASPRRVFQLWLLLLCLSFVASVNPPAQAQRAAAACDAKWESEIQKFEASDRESAPPRGATLFIGSSSIRLWSDLKSDFSSAAVLNRGFGGSEIADSTCFVDRIVAPYKPSMIFLYAGGNDLANGKSPQQVFANFQAFVTRVQLDLPETRIAFISIAPNPARWHMVESVKTTNALVKEFTSRDSKLSYVDVFTPMLGADGKPRPELFVEDRLHMNRKGYELWRSILQPLVR